MATVETARRRWILVGVVAAWILATSLAPASAAAPGRETTTLLGVGLDKWLHAGAYFLLAAAGAFALADHRASPRAMLGLFVGVALLGIAVEGLQAPLATRNADAADAVANALGAALAVAGWRLSVGVRERRASAERADPAGQGEDGA